MAEARAAVGYLVAVAMPDGTWDARCDGLWETPEDAEAERDEAEAERMPGDPERYAVCAVIPVEEPR